MNFQYHQKKKRKMKQAIRKAAKEKKKFIEDSQKEDEYEVSKVR